MFTEAAATKDSAITYPICKPTEAYIFNRSTGMALGKNQSRRALNL
jgi:hypothetical protein